MPTTTARPSYFPAAIAAAAVFVLYLVTLAPSTAMWDTSEYITAAYTLGLPHPPGNPFFVLIGRVFSILPIAPNIAMRINLLAALSSAVTAGIWFLVTERVLQSWIEERWARWVGAALASLIGATAFTVWAQSVVNEKVYTVSLVGIAIVSWLIVRWCENPDAPKAHRLLVLAAYLMGLGYANHMAGLLTLPAMGIAILLRKPATLLRWRVLLACVGALALGATPFATQPIRAAHFPAINEGEPTGCATAISVACTFSAQTRERFEYNFNRMQYAKPPVTQRQAPASAQLGMWWLYFKWQWLRDPTDSNGRTQDGLAFTFFALGLLGAWVHFKRDRASFVYFGPLMVTLTLVLIYYLNFRYGASQAPFEFCRGEDPSPCEVRDRDYFFLWSFSAWSVWAAAGLVFAWRTIAKLLTPNSAGADALRHRRTAYAITAPVLAVAVIPLLGNWNAASRRGDTDTADWARDLLNSVEPYGILVTAGDNDMFPLWYAQEVEGVRRDVLLANTSLMNTQWFVRQMIRRPGFAYDTATGPALYRGRTWTRPSASPFNMTLEEADLVPDYVDARQPTEFEADGIKTQIPPQTLMRADVLVYKLIQDNPGRTVHFAATTADYPVRLGLGDYITIHGLTLKLAHTAVAPNEHIRRDQSTGRWIDVDATKSLWSGFGAPASIARKNKWIDRASIAVPMVYLRTGLTLSDTMLQRGDSTGSRAVFDAVRGVANAVGYGDSFKTRPRLQPPLADTAK